MGSRRKMCIEPGTLFTPEKQKEVMAMIQKAASISQTILNWFSTLNTSIGETSGISCALSLTHIKRNSWVLNTRAMDHVYHFLLLFQTHKQIKPALIKLPDGSQVTATISGTVVFSPSLFLTNVLTFNLILVSKLTNTLPCQVIFFASNYQIQDMPSSKMIGVADN